MSIDSRLRKVIQDLLDGMVPIAVAEEQFEKKYIEEALMRSEGNITRAAKLIGVHRNTIHNKTRRMERFRVP